MFKKMGKFFNKIKVAIANFFFRNRFGTVMLLVGGIIAFWDLVLKYLLDGKEMSAINGVFRINSAHNTGGAWSIFSNNTTFLIIVTVVFLFVILLLNYAYKRKDYFYAISMGLLLGGAICNLFDRIKYGYVRDFIELEFINFPVFNVADMAITIGVILIIIYFLFISPKYEEKYYTVADDNSVKFVDKYHIIKKSNIIDEKARNNQITKENSFKIVDNSNTINKNTKNQQKNTNKIKNNNKKSTKNKEENKNIELKNTKESKENTTNSNEESDINKNSKIKKSGKKSNKNTSKPKITKAKNAK